MWHFFKWGSAASPAMPVGAGVPAWVQRMRMKMVCTLTASAKTESIWIAALGAIPLRRKGGIVLSFDDNWLEMYEIVYPLAKHYNVPTTFFWNGKAIETHTDPLKVTKAQAIEMATDPSGMCCIGNHGWEHVDLFSMTAAEYCDGFDKMRDYIRTELGCAVSGDIYAYTFGHSSPAAYDEFARRGYRAGRQTSANYAGSRTETFALGDRMNWVWSNIASLQSPTTVDQVIAACRTVGTNRSIGYILGHQVGAADTIYGWERKKIEELYARLAADRDEGLYDLWRADDIAIDVGV